MKPEIGQIFHFSFGEEGPEVKKLHYIWLQCIFEMLPKDIPYTVMSETSVTNNMLFDFLFTL
jgi:hypothetical protein